MDRKSAYKAKSTTGALDRATRQIRADDKRKRDRTNLLMTKRGLGDLTNKENTQCKTEKPMTLKETDASKKRREELEKWLKKKEEQKKKEALCQKKPFYAGSAMVMSIGTFGYSVKPHACAHGSKASSGGGKEVATAPQQQTKPTAGSKNKATTAVPQNRRPVTRAQTLANGKDKRPSAASTSRPAPSSKPRPPSSSRAAPSRQSKTAVSTATVVKGKAPPRKAALQTVTKVAEKQETTLDRKQPQRNPNTSRFDASNISTADLPWVSGATLPLDQTTLPPADFEECFSKEFASPFQFGQRSPGRGHTHTKKTVEAAGFQFTFEAKAVFNKERVPYNPHQSLVTVMRGEPATESPDRKFSFVPADDLLTSPELSSASGQDSDLVTKAKEAEEDLCVTAACSTRKALFNDTTDSKTPHIQFTCVVTPSKSTGRYSTRSNLEMSHKAERLRQPNQKQAVEKESEDVAQKAIFDDSLEGDGADDGSLGHSARTFEFHAMHQKEVSRLEERCAVWEGKMEQLQQKAEQEEDDPARFEEAVDLVRMTVCMTRLLVKEKLKQFSDLCFRAENVHAVQPVKLDDLQAFWDMVHLQVEGLDSKFEHLEKLEQNSWCPVPTEKKGRRGRKKGAPRARKSVSTATVSSDSSSEKSGSEAGRKRESARLKLKQMKEAAKRAKSNRGESGGMDDVMVMFPGMKVADSREGSVFKAPPSVVLSANEETGGTVQARTPVTVGQQGVRTRGSSLRRSTRKSKIIDPAQFGYDFSEFITSAPLSLTKPKREFILTTHQPISSPGGGRMDGDECEVPQNADLTFYTTHPSTPPCLEDVAYTLLGGGGGADDSLDFLKDSEEKGTESAPSCPVENLIVFTPTPKAKRRKSRSGPAAVSRRRGSIKMFSQISPSGYLRRSRNHIFEQGVDMLMSPVRRSSRILVTPSTSARKASRMEVIDLNDLPANQRVGVVPNSNLMLS